MTVTSLYPVLMTTEVAASAAFFTDRLGFTPTFETDWYVSLQRDGAELAVLDREHETIPEAYRGRSGSGLLVNIEVDDVDAEHRRLVVEAGLVPVLDVRTETFGQRHFILAGPDGVLVDVIQVIPYGEDFADAAR